MAILGLDIGGANIKAADASGRAISRPFAIWRHPERLTVEIVSILQEFPDTDQIALTMTAELADCFSTKAEGVRFILDVVERCIGEMRRNPLTPQGRGEGTRDAHRANDIPIRDPSCDEQENPLTLTLSPQGRGEGTGDALRANDIPIRDPSCDAQENPLTLTLSPQSRGEGTGDAHRANDIPIRDPSCDAQENPLTLTLSPQGRGEGTRDAHRANDIPIRDPSCDAQENPLTLTLSPQSRGEGTGDALRANDIPIRDPSCDAQENPLTLTLSPQGRGEGTGVWSTDGRFVLFSEGRDEPRKIAAANWHALATWCGRFVPTGPSLLVDIGTTTTDIIPLNDGKPVAIGLTDVDRLQSGELSYSGVKRTPLCAMVQCVPFREGYCPLAAELFATTLDIYLLLGDIAEDSTDVDTANGKPATKAAAYDRLARMLCCDRDEIPFDEAVDIARFIADVQRQRLAGALERVLQRLPGKCQSVILSGSGAFLARQLISGNRHLTNVKVISLSERLSPDISDAACASAVAQLASQAK